MKLELNNGHIFTYQAPATLNQAAPVQNTWYTILDTTANVIIYQIATNIEDTNEDIEIRVTLDGETIGCTTHSHSHSTTYLWAKEPDAINRADSFTGMGITNQHLLSAFQLFGKSAKVEVRKTTAAGAGNLCGIVTYGVLEAI